MGTRKPHGVYWSREAGNFYRESDNRGMGWDFYNKWRSRKDEFPEKRTTVPDLDLTLAEPVIPLENG